MFLTLPFEFFAANIRPNDMVTGAPSMTAVSGMAHNLGRILSEQYDLPSIKVKAFTLVYFSFDKDQGGVRFPAQKMSGPDATLATPFDTRRGHGQAALVVLLDGEGKDLNNLMALVSDEVTLGCLLCDLGTELRFAGGTIHIGLKGETGEKELMLRVQGSWLSVLDELISVFPTKGLLVECKSKLLSDHALARGEAPLNALMNLLYLSQCERQKRYSTAPEAVTGESGQDRGPIELTDEFNDLLFADHDVLADVVSAYLDATPLEDGCATPSEEPYLGVLLPLMVGFHEVGQARGEQYFAEGVLSLGRLRSIRSVRADCGSSNPDWYQMWQRHFWCWQTDETLRLHRAVSCETFS